MRNKPYKYGALFTFRRTFSVLLKFKGDGQQISNDIRQIRAQNIQIM